MNSKSKNMTSNTMPNINVNADPTNTSTTIEFLLSTLVSKMGLKVNQALAFLSNSNVLLIHVIIKGLKGSYKPVISWYEELLLHCKFMVSLFESETEGLTSAIRVLDIVKTGLYSKSTEIANLTMRLMGKIATEMNDIGMSGISWDWLITNNGLQILLKAIEQNKELINENLVSIFFQFARNNLIELFTHSIPSILNKSYIELIIKILEYLKDYKSFRDELVRQGVIVYWINIGCNKGDIVNDDINQRSIALSFLLELWVCFPYVVEGSTEYPDMIMHVLQRAARDKIIGLQIVSIIVLFKLLSNFVVEKSPYALPIYKSLTFALVENYHRAALRELILYNFKEIFNYCASIPISILLDPLFKQIVSSEDTLSTLDLAEFEFFNCIVQHPKLNAGNGVKLLDILAKFYIHVQVFCGCTYRAFFTASNRFKSTKDFYDFVGQLIQYVLEIYCENMERIKEGKGKDIPLLKAQNSRIIKLLFLVISLDNTEINEYIANWLIEANRVIKLITNNNDEDFVELLEAMGEDKEILNYAYAEDEAPSLIEAERYNPLNELKESLRNSHQLVRSEQSGKSRSRSVLSKGIQSLNTKKEYHNQSKLPTLNGPKSNFTLYETTSKQRKTGCNTIIKKQPKLMSMKNNSLSTTPEPYRGTKVKGEKRANHSLNTTVIPNKVLLNYEIHKSKHNKTPLAISNGVRYEFPLLEEKAVIELEQVKKKRDEQLLKKQMEESKRQAKEKKRDRIIKQRLDIRNIEHNIAIRNQHNIEQELLLNEGLYKKLTLPLLENDAKLQTIDDEEERDIEALKLFIDQHKRVFRYLFSKYANSGFSVKPKGSFEELRHKLDTISLAEAIKMLKDHNITSNQISQVEIASLFRQVNFKILHESNVLSLNYPGFIEFLVQAAIHIFSKDPVYNSTKKSPADYTKLLFNYFRQAAKLKGENIVLYENPEATTLGDPEVIQELTEYVTSNPSYPLPEGYKKVEEKSIKEQYTIPKHLQFPENLRICIEVMDEILNKALGVHILEPITTYEYKTRIVPTIGRICQRRTYEKNYMLPVTKRLRSTTFNKERHNFSLRQMNEKIVEPKLTGKMKVMVAEAKNEMKGIVKEIAEIVSEIVDAVVCNRTNIGTKLKWGPGIVLNRVMQEKLCKIKGKEIEDEKKEQKRKLRAVILKNTLQELKKDKLKKEQEIIQELNRKKETERAKSLKEREIMKKRRQRLMEEKQKRVEEGQIKQQIELQNQELEKKRKAEEMQQLRKLRKEKLKLEFRNIVNEREKKLMEQEKKKYLEELKFEKSHKIVNEKLEKEREKIIQVKQQKARLKEFLERGDIEFTIARYRKALQYIFQYFSQQEDLQLNSNPTLDLPKFAKLCLHFKFIPVLILGEHAVELFRQILKTKQNKSTSMEYRDFEEALVKLAVLLKNRLKDDGEVLDGSLNKEYQTEGLNARVLENIMNYMNVKVEDTKVSLSKKLMGDGLKTVLRKTEKEVFGAVANKSIKLNTMQDGSRIPVYTLQLDEDIGNIKKEGEVPNNEGTISVRDVDKPKEDHNYEEYKVKDVGDKKEVNNTIANESTRTNRFTPLTEDNGRIKPILKVLHDPINKQPIEDIKSDNRASQSIYIQPNEIVESEEKNEGEDYERQVKVDTLDNPKENVEVITKENKTEIKIEGGTKVQVKESDEVNINEDNKDEKKESDRVNVEEQVKENINITIKVNTKEDIEMNKRESDELNIEEQIKKDCEVNSGKQVKESVGIKGMIKDNEGQSDKMNGEGNINESIKSSKEVNTVENVEEINKTHKEGNGEINIERSIEAKQEAKQEEVKIEILKEINEENPMKDIEEIKDEKPNENLIEKPEENIEKHIEKKQTGNTEYQHKERMETVTKDDIRGNLKSNKEDDIKISTEINAKCKTEDNRKEESGVDAMSMEDDVIKQQYDKTESYKYPQRISQPQETIVTALEVE